MTKVAPNERNEAGRKKILAGWELLCPNVIGNPYIPHWPIPAQALFLGLHQHQKGNQVFQALYGGAAGGGKSDALLMAAAQYAWKNGDFAGLCFRRSYTELSMPGALMDRAIQWWSHSSGCHWSGTDKTFRFANGAKISFAYLSAPNDHLRYQGSEVHFTAWDELTQWESPSSYEYVGISRVRRKEGCKIPLRTLAASNPGGPGHQWVMKKFIGSTNPETGESEKASHLYVPSLIQDNPHLDRQTYIEGLKNLHPTVRAQLLDGNWKARDQGDYFRAEWFGPLLDPSVDLWPSKDCVRVRWWDLAASEKEGAARTAGVLMARSRFGVRAIEHCRAFKATPGKRDDLIIQTAQMDGHGVVVGIEIEGGSGGPAQFFALEKRLKEFGFKVVGARPKAELTRMENRVIVRGSSGTDAKQSRADPVASCLERGYQMRGEGADNSSVSWGRDVEKSVIQNRDGIRLFMGQWTQDFMNEVESFPNASRCDVVDATSGAWAWLEAHPLGFNVPSSLLSEQKKLSIADHPEDRAEKVDRFFSDGLSKNR